MGDPRSPERMAALEAELADVARRVERQVEPGPIALAVSIVMFALIGTLLLPWSGAAPGWAVLSGSALIDPLPRAFTFTVVGFGLVGSAVALATRRWALAWLCAVGCGFAVLNGVLAIWSRWAAGPGPAVGMVLALCAMFVLALCWVRVAVRR